MNNFLASLARALILVSGALGVVLSIIAQKIDKNYTLPASIAFLIGAGMGLLMIIFANHKKIYVIPAILFLIAGLLALSHT